MSGGVASALEQVVDEAAEAVALVQSGLFDDLDVTETGALTTRTPISGAHPLADALAKRKGGRPPGARNRRTEATVRFLLAQGRHPVQAMMEMYALTPEQLAERIGLRHATKTVKDDSGHDREIDTSRYSNDVLLELLKLQTRMMEAVAPYVAQKLPQAVQVSANGHLTVAFGGVSLPARGGSATEILDGEAVERPAMSVTLPIKSDDGGRTNL